MSWKLAMHSLTELCIKFVQHRFWDSVYISYNYVYTHMCVYCIGVYVYIYVYIYILTSDMHIYNIGSGVCVWQLRQLLIIYLVQPVNFGLHKVSCYQNGVCPLYNIETLMCRLHHPLLLLRQMEKFPLVLPCCFKQNLILR